MWRKHGVNIRHSSFKNTVNTPLEMLFCIKVYKITMFIRIHRIHGIRNRENSAK